MEETPVVNPIGLDTLSHEYKRKALEAVNIIKEKRNAIK